jgi:hypothetical protein
MKNSLLLLVTLTAGVQAFSQSGNTFLADADKVFGLAKDEASKQGFHYLIKFATTNQAAIYVTPNTNYEIFFVYDNTKRPLPNFKAHLMTPDSSLMEKYTVKSFDRAQVGTARAHQLEFTTGGFTGKNKPVRLEAKPPAYIYVFYKNLPKK